MEAIVLRTIDYQDHAKLLYVYTETGIKSLIARGVKKMNSPWRHLAQVTNLLEIDLSKGKLPTLKEAKLLDYYPTIKNDLIKQTVFNAVCEYVYYNVTDDDHHPKLFNFIKKLAKTLETSKHPLEILAIFELKFLHFLGYSPGLKDCHQCGTKENLRYDITIGALICAAHQNLNHTHVSQTIYQPMQVFYRCDIQTYQPLNLDTTTQQKLNDVTTSLFEMHLGFKSKAKKVLSSLYFGG